MHAFLISTGIVARAEMGDKAQMATISVSPAIFMALGLWALLGRSVTQSRQHWHHPGRAFNPSKQVIMTRSMISSSLCSSLIFRNSSTGSQARAYRV